MATTQRTTSRPTQPVARPSAPTAGRGAARVGFGAAVTVTLLGVAYLGLMLTLGLSGTGFPPPEPYATLIGLVTLLSAATLVVVMAAVHVATAADRQALSLSALALTVIFAALTSINRYVQLTVIPQAVAAGQTDGLALFQPYDWPSIMLALELLAWGGYLGLALIFAGLSLVGRRPGLGWLCGVCGGLCLFAGVGQVVQQSWMLWVGVAGWGPGLCVITGWLAYEFRKEMAAA